MMTQKERKAEKKRLIEALIGFPLMDCAIISRRDAEDIADKLIDAIGVIVPPCWIGDTIMKYMAMYITNTLLKKALEKKLYLNGTNQQYLRQ